jgi:PTS system fructose-specific IIC component
MTNENRFKGFFGDIRKHLMSGVSYMIPLIVTFGMFMLLGQIPGPTQEAFSKISEYAQMLIVPVLATYIAYSIGGKPAVATGLVVGLMADQMGMGYIGGLLVGLLTGYFVKLEQILVTRKQGGQWKDFLISFLVIPILTPLVVGSFIYFVVANPISAFMVVVNNWLTDLSVANAVILSLILGAMIGFDMGGPINKIAYTFALGAFTEGAFTVSTPVWVAISIPTWAMVLASFIAPKKYSEEERRAGRNGIVMALIGLTEGAIPFAATDPLRVIPVLMLGSAMGAVMTTLLGVTTNVMFPSLMGLMGVNKPLLYLLCHIVPTVITAFLINAIKKPVEQKEEEE